MSDQPKVTQFDLEYFFELSADLLCIAGYDGYFKKINPAVTKALGYSMDELRASPIDHFVHPEDRELTSRKRQELRNGETLFQFENRYIAKNGDIVWLFWTSVPIERDHVIFAIAKDITHRKKSEDHQHVLDILKNLNTDQMQRFSTEVDIIKGTSPPENSNLKWMGNTSPVSEKDQLWLNKFEAVVRHFIGSLDINLKTLSTEMAISERQMYREVGRIMGTTPNKLIRIIRLHLAWEAIASRKHRTLGEIARIAGYASTTHFKKLFLQLYGIDVAELL